MDIATENRPTESRLRAGAGRAEIALSEAVLPLDGFTRVSDPLYVRVLLLESGQQRTALAVLDQTSIFDDQLLRTKEIIRGSCDVSPDASVVVASHTFSAPHLFADERLPPGERERNARLREAVDSAVEEAALQAARSLRAARIGRGEGTCRANVNRDVATEDGWWLGSDDGAPSDHTVRVLRVEDAHDGLPLAVVFNYAVQSSVVHLASGRSRERVVSADLAGAAAAHIEAHTGAIALFLTGAAADQAPYLTADDVPSALVVANLLGRRLGAEATRVAQDIRALGVSGPLRVLRERIRVPAQMPPPSMDALRPVPCYDFRPDGETLAPVAILRIGDLALVCLQAEVTQVTAKAIRELSPFARTWIATMADGAAKYMADESSYDRSTYASMNSRYGRGAAEAVVARTVELLKEI